MKGYTHTNTQRGRVYIHTLTHRVGRCTYTYIHTQAGTHGSLSYKLTLVLISEIAAAIPIYQVYLNVH